jgi:hypothetical protein
LKRRLSATLAARERGDGVGEFAVDMAGDECFANAV